MTLPSLPLHPFLQALVVVALANLAWDMGRWFAPLTSNDTALYRDNEAGDDRDAGEVAFSLVNTTDEPILIERWRVGERVVDWTRDPEIRRRTLSPMSERTHARTHHDHIVRLRETIAVEFRRGADAPIETVTVVADRRRPRDCAVTVRITGYGHEAGTCQPMQVYNPGR